jgi:hypothetical protein
MRNTGENNPRYALALNWLDKPHTSPHAGAVVVSYRPGHNSAGRRGGHVALIRQVIDHCTAIVSDDRGTYKRNICKNFAAFVKPGGDRAYASASFSSRAHGHHHAPHRHHHIRQALKRLPVRSASG